MIRNLITSLFESVRFQQALGAVIFIGLWTMFGLWARLTQQGILQDFAIAPTLDAFGRLLSNGTLFEAIGSSMWRVFWGIFYAIVVGVPIGILIGLNSLVRAITLIPIQFLRMTSPLSLMPIVVILIPTWNAGIIFLLAFASVWSVMLSTSTAIGRIDFGWLKIADNYQISFLQKIRFVILPAIIPDILTGVRLSVGICWVVLVPAEFLGVTSGLGYAINDARDTLDYSAMTAIVLVIGAIGYCIDSLLRITIKNYEWIR